MAVKGPQARRAPRSSRLAPAQRRAHGASLRGQCPRPVLAGVTRPVTAQRVRVGRGALESLGQARGQTPHPLQLAGPAVTSRALPEPSGAFRGSADGTSVRNLLCNKTTHKVKCRLKSVSAGQQFLWRRVSWRSGDLSACYPGGLGRVGGAPGASWRQWVPRSCSLDGPQMGAMRTTHSGAPAGWGQEQAGTGGRGCRGAEGAPPNTPHSAQARPRLLRPKSCREANAGIRFPEASTKPLAVGSGGHVSREAGLWPSPESGAGFEEGPKVPAVRSAPALREEVLERSHRVSCAAVSTVPEATALWGQGSGVAACSSQLGSRVPSE